MHIQISNLSFGYDYRTVLKNISFSLEIGDFLVVVGNNGSGKSTLVKCILGINPVPSKKVFLDGTDINDFKKWVKIGYVPQKMDDFNYEFPISVNEIMHVSKSSKVSEKEKLELFDRMGILELQNENINSLSGGQMQRVFIARAMINKPEVLILDEPTIGVDTDNVNRFYRIINDLNSEGVTIILITHSLQPGKANFNHVMHLHEGVAEFTSVSDMHEGGDD